MIICMIENNDDNDNDSINDKHMFRLHDDIYIYMIENNDDNDNDNKNDQTMERM